MNEHPPPAAHYSTRPEDISASRATVLRRLALWLAVLGMVLTTGVAAYAAVAIRQSQQANKPTIGAAARAAKAAEQGTKRIEDCTTPGRKCYDDGTRRQAQIIGDLNRVIVLAAYCADRSGDQTVEQIQGCVIAKLATHDKPTP